MGILNHPGAPDGDGEWSADFEALLSSGTSWRHGLFLYRDAANYVFVHDTLDAFPGPLARFWIFGKVVNGVATIVRNTDVLDINSQGTAGLANAPGRLALKRIGHTYVATITRNSIETTIGQLELSPAERVVIPSFNAVQAIVWSEWAGVSTAIDNFSVPGACGPDGDGDGVPDATDNCPATPNPGQEDLDGDGLGDVCDGDADADGQSNEDEVACGSDPLSAVSLAADLDADGRPDCVDPDRDGDGIDDGDDNCPSMSNPDQTDADGDGLGAACDPNDATDPIAALRAAVTASVSKPGIAKALISKIDQIEAALARGNQQAASGAARAFINQVHAQTGKSISPADAAALIAAVLALL
ncbi:MAG: hypothetical protein FJW23_04680 [Acidimicrobiia bacterium]|nr:hypothetical protein [Acidimicrobiia bacterium]